MVGNHSNKYDISPLFSLKDSISKTVQLMCSANYNVTVTPYFNVYLIPGTAFAIFAVLLNLFAIFIFWKLRKDCPESSGRSLVHFTILSVTDIFIACTFSISQIHAMQFYSYDDRIISHANDSICIGNKTHGVDILFTVFETSQRSGRLIKGYSLLRYFSELTNRFSHVYLAIDRTAMVCFPFTYGFRKQHIDDSSSALEFLIFAILPSILINIVFIGILMSTSSLEFIYEFYLVMVTTLVAPLLPLLISAVILAIKVLLEKESSPPQLKEGLRNLSQMTLWLVLLFILCEVPNFVFQLALWAGIDIIADTKSDWYFFFNYSQHVSRMASSFCNFFVYYCLSKLFRSKFNEQLKTFLMCYFKT